MGFFKKDPRPTVDCSVEPSRTRQSHKESCDINFIVGQYRRTGQILHVAGGIPRYGDVSESGDFREVMDRVRNAEAWFIGLPAKVRAEFDNEVVTFMDAMSDPAQRAKLEELGVVPAQKAPPAEAAGGAGHTVST